MRSAGASITTDRESCRSHQRLLAFLGFSTPLICSPVSVPIISVPPLRSDVKLIPLAIAVNRYSSYSDSMARTEGVAEREAIVERPAPPDRRARRRQETIQE